MDLIKKISLLLLFLFGILFPKELLAFDFDKEVDRAVDSLNKFIRHNESLVVAGQAANRKFVVDLRYELHKKLNPIDEAALNVKLNEINERKYANGQSIAFYVLLTTLQKPILASSMDAGTDYPNLKIYLEKTSGITDAEWIDYINSKAGENAEQKYKNELKRYTEAVHRKSLLGDEANKGLLLNLHSTYKIDSKDYSSAILYNAVLSVGKGLRTESVRQALKVFSTKNVGSSTLVSNATRKLYDANDNGASLNIYVAKVEEVLYKLGTNYNFGTDPQGQTLEEEETIFNLTSQIYTKLSSIKTNGVPIIKENVNLKVIDYSGITNLDNSFFQKVVQITDKGGLISIQDAKDKMMAKFIKVHVFVTSDHNPGEYEKYARELAITKRNEKNYIIDEYIIVGLHLYTKQPLMNGNIPMQVTTLMNQRLEDRIETVRKDINNGLYSWYINRKTGDIVFCNPVALNYSGSAYVNMEDWKFLGNKATTEDGKKVFNNYSDNWLIYKILSNTDDNDELFNLFIFTIEAEAAIILAVPTAGISVEVFIAEQSGKYLLKQTAKTAFMSVMSQFAMHCLTSEKPIEEAYKDFAINYNDLATDVLTDVFVKNYRAQQFLVCLNGMYNKYDVLSRNNINITAFELTDGCLRDLIVFSAKEQAGPIFKKLQEMSIKQAVKALRYIKFSDNVIRKILKLLGKSQSEIDAEIPLVNQNSSTSSSYNPDQYSEYLDTPDNLPGDGGDIKIKPLGKIITRTLDAAKDYKIVDRVKALRKSLPSDFKRNGNFGWAETENLGLSKNEYYAHSQIQNLNLPSIKERAPNISIQPENEIFPWSIELDINGNPIKRNVDTEYKILTEIAEKLGDNVKATGTIRLFTERKPCPSCSNVIKLFSEKYENIIIEVIHNNDITLTDF